ncbi:MAG: hypothetical protein ACXVXJ_06295 [Mycobacteriaceae bacterium]
MQTLFHDLGNQRKRRRGMDNILSIGEMQVPITRIADLRELRGMEWITALRAPAVAALARDGGPLHMPALLGWANSWAPWTPARPQWRRPSTRTSRWPRPRSQGLQRPARARLSSGVSATVSAPQKSMAASTLTGNALTGGG